jgi:hypothetical protein
MLDVNEVALALKSIILCITVNLLGGAKLVVDPIL